MKKKYNDNSEKYSDWTTKKLKQYAIELDDSIYGINACYGSHDLFVLSGVLDALNERGVEFSNRISFN